ncbi:class I SAM-dependent methyltransferase [Yoonia sediminilitoris]|uniref:16S rRNA m(2)G 1207 methyltransferase n=1 Tax=Yoonia sediminilitoris TaxID=1286148 RepID=A0A2T6K7I1_9RHOB|nr:methyltransferase [Yoonia sediminilitoris]PUB10675.1 16S rRNA m(2)G 1207 methyltransferase [Yoonia sediminilitoris]RCW90427.1 16S rRNA m(2)G 1207 methyltransferase [Yoonia sediminilitoris]
MSQSRLSTAIQDGQLSLPAGRVKLMRPPATYDVTALPRDAIMIDHGFYPDYRAWQNAAYPQADGRAATAIVVVPRAKKLARAMIHDACATADLVIVDGQKTDGVDGLYKDCRKRLGNLPTVTKGHGRLFWFDASDAFADWAAPQATKGPHGYYNLPGVFSDGAVDKGSALLTDCLPPKLPKRMADLGAGWGYLAGGILARQGVQSLDLIEAEKLSLACARLNVTDPRVAFHWADATAFEANPAYDGIVMNPPFHTTRAADHGLGRAFIQAAARLLTPQGKLWMVANRHLPYEGTLAESFRNVDMIADNGAFKVFRATKPQR